MDGWVLFCDMLYYFYTLAACTKISIEAQMTRCSFFCVVFIIIIIIYFLQWIVNYGQADLPTGIRSLTRKYVADEFWWISFTVCV